MSVVDVSVVEVSVVDVSVVEEFVAPPALEVVGAPPLEALLEASSEQPSIATGSSAPRSQRSDMARWYGGSLEISRRIRAPEA